MYLEPISRIEGISPQDFRKQYFLPKTPVVISDFIRDSPAMSKWSYPYFKEIAGDLPVSVYGKEDAFNDHVSSPPVSQMSFAEYLDLIDGGPTESRLFLFNLLQKRPELKKDLVYNDVTGGSIVSWMPFMFFGGEGSSVRNHFDIDMSHVFLSQFHGEKTVWLFPLSESSLLYKLPFNFHGLANLKEPDYEKYPGLKHLQGWECTIKPGDTLYIPSGFWHYIQYSTGGYSVSLRALPGSFADKLAGFRNLFLTRPFDNAMRVLFKDKWFDHKIKAAQRRANRRLRKLSV